ncbi:MAG: hypothetical protein AABZ74_16180 [Cyanobacteriota bacterium]
MISLTKKEESYKILLDKNSEDIIIATAQWVDNGDGQENDDLDLRAGLLLPDGKMVMIHCDSPGDLENKPYILHLGDIKEASLNKPGQEIMKVNPKISKHYNAPIAIVFSVYSAIDNGAVSVASLKPKMKIEYKDKIVECAYDFSSSPINQNEKLGFFSKISNKFKSFGNSYIYTYVLGIVIIKDNEVEIMPSGLTSKPSSEATPQLKWNNNTIITTVDGPSLFKD